MIKGSIQEEGTTTISIYLSIYLSFYRCAQHRSISMHKTNAAAAAKSHQSCLTLCDPIDGSPPGFPIPGILQARTLEWAAISFSNAWKWKVKVKSLSRVRLLAIPLTAAHQAPPSLGFSRQEHGVGCPVLLQCMKVISESEVTQSCPTLSDPMDRSPPGSSVHGIFQARVLEWGAIAFSVVPICNIQAFIRKRCSI